MSKYFFILTITLMCIACGGKSPSTARDNDSVANEEIVASADSIAEIKVEDRHITRKNFIAFLQRDALINIDNLLKNPVTARFDTTYVFGDYKQTVKRNIMPFTTKYQSVYAVFQFDELPNSPRIDAFFATKTRASVCFGEDSAYINQIPTNLNLYETSKTCGKILTESAFNDVISEEYFNAESGQSYCSDFSIHWANKDVITYECTEYSYVNGAAHGNGDFRLITFNRHSGKPLEFKDYILPEKEMIVRRLLIEALAIELEFESADLFLEFERNNWLMRNDLTIKNFPIESVGMSRQGLVFSYSKYSIAPGASGCPSVVLPYSLIADCLKPSV